MAFNRYSNYIILPILLLLSSDRLFAQILSDFSTDFESWSTFNEGAGGAPTTIDWHATGGNPGGYISAQDVSVGAWYWFGPSKFRGDLSGYFGCTLYFDLLEDSHLGDMSNYYDVMFFNSSGDTMVFNTAVDPVPVNNWKHYVVPLTTVVGWKYGSSIGGGAPNATSAQMTAILGSVKRMRIRAEYSGLTYEVDGLDNVYITCGYFLPVELVDFNAVEDGENIARLSWTTLSENNCSGFYIQKSTNGVSFQTIGFVEGQGTTNNENYYEFIDDNFTTTSYYDLKQMDFDGNFEYSNIISLIPTEQSKKLQIFPNPASDYLNLLYSGQSQVLSITIKDMLGHIVYRKFPEAKIESYQGPITLKDCRSGMYSLTIQSLSGSETILFEVIK